MRIIIAFLLVIIAVPAFAVPGDSTIVPGVWYVDKSIGSDVSIDTPWGRSEVYPGASPTVMLTHMAQGDTLIICGYDLDVTDPYYEFFQLGDTRIDCVGYSAVGDDSPTFSDTGSIHRTTSAFNGIRTVIDGIKFINAQANGSIIYTKTDGIVRNCVFDSNTTGLCFVYFDLSVNNPRFPILYNNVFINFYGSLAAYSHGAVRVIGSTANTQDTMTMTLDHNTFRSCNYVLATWRMQQQSANYDVFTFSNSLFDSCGLYSGRDENFNYIKLYYEYSDTSGSSEMRADLASLKYEVFYDNVVDTDPLFTDDLGTANDWLCYYTNSSISAAGNDGLPMGVLWGYQPPTPPAPAGSSGRIGRTSILQQYYLRGVF